MLLILNIVTIGQSFYKGQTFPLRVLDFIIRKLISSGSHILEIKRGGWSWGFLDYTDPLMKKSYV